MGKFTPLYQFDNTHGSTPYAPLVQGTDGNFYGTAGYGGTLGYGVIFKMAATGKLTVLYNFDGTHGANPDGPLIQGSDGNFYGTTFFGGTSNGGVVFKITPTGSLTVLHNMNRTTDGFGSSAGLVQATDGNFYGTNSDGGSHGFGTIFKVTFPTTSFSVLYNFDNTTGAFPSVTLFQHTNGVIYGDTYVGGTIGPGVFYSLNVGLAPFVTFLPPQSSGKVGKTIEFFGQGFKSSTTVSFYGGVAATPSVKSGTYLTAAVPNGALTGVIAVTTSGATLKSNKIFRVIPQITSFSPTSGPVGTVVTITGVSLKQTTRVTFGGMKETTVTVVNDTEVKATVPSGAVTGKIAITTPGGTAVSSGVFTVT